jgi:hypothetical protein
MVTVATSHTNDKTASIAPVPSSTNFAAPMSRQLTPRSRSNTPAWTIASLTDKAQHARMDDRQFD